MRADSTPPGKPRSEGGGARDWTDAFREAAPFLGLGVTLAVTVLAGVGAGYWLDGRFGTRPVFLLLGGCAGLGVGMYQLITSVANLSKDKADRKQ